MDIHTNIPLKNYTTMKIGGNAKFMTEVHTADEAAQAYRTAKTQNLPVFVLGGGSNVIAKDEGFDGIVIRMRVLGFDVITDDINSTTIRIGAGENWDSVVKRSVDMGLSGIEAMSAIPGTAGAAPVQNVGAYGQEIADTLQSLEAYDSQTDTFVIMQRTDCEFGYRESIFHAKSPGRYIITSITLKLSKNQPQPPLYDSLQKYLDKHGIKTLTVDVIRNAVIEIRKDKLPDPNILPNCGSFFKNVVIEKWQVDDLLKIYPDAPVHEMGDGRFKISAGWLIENVNLRGCLIHGIRISDKNSLVLINESAGSYDDLADAREEIVGKVRDKFQIQMQQEPIEVQS